MLSISPKILILDFILVVLTSSLQIGFGQGIENWQTYVDHDKRFTLFYPPDLQAKGKENFLSSIDMTLTKPDSPRPFKITITYSINDTNLDYTGNEIIKPEYNLRKLEDLLMPSYQSYNRVEGNLSSYSLYGFPTVGSVIDYTKHDGESGRVLNILGIIKGKNSFLFSYSNSIEAFYKYLPTVNEILKSIIILK